MARLVHARGGPPVPPIGHGSEHPAWHAFQVQSSVAGLLVPTWYGYEKHFLKLKSRFSSQPEPVRVKHSLSDEPAAPMGVRFIRQLPDLTQGSTAWRNHRPLIAHPSCLWSRGVVLC